MAGGVFRGQNYEITTSGALEEHGWRGIPGLKLGQHYFRGSRGKRGKRYLLLEGRGCHIRTVGMLRLR